MARVGGVPLDETPPEDTIAVTDEQTRAAAAELGLDYATLEEGDKEFVAMFAAASQLDAEAADAPDPAAAPHPLIPSEDNPNPGAEEVAASTADADEAGSGPDESSSGGAPVPPGAGTAVVEPPVPPAPPVPPTPPPFPPQPPAPITPQLTEQEQQYLDGLRQGYIQPRFVDPETGREIIINAQGEAVIAPPPLPGMDEEWDDPRAQAAIAALYDRMSTQMSAFTAQQQATEAQAQAQQRAQLEAGMDLGVADFKAATGLDDAKIEEMTNSPEVSQHLVALAPRYPGDIRSAVNAALTASYYADPELRAAAIEAEVNRRIASNATVEQKKASAASLGASTGSVPRTAPAPRTRDERVVGMAGVIETAMREEQGSNGQG